MSRPTNPKQRGATSSNFRPQRRLFTATRAARACKGQSERPDEEQKDGTRGRDICNSNAIFDLVPLFFSPPPPPPTPPPPVHVHPLAFGRVRAANTSSTLAWLRRSRCGMPDEGRKFACPDRDAEDRGRSPFSLWSCPSFGSLSITFLRRRNQPASPRHSVKTRINFGNLTHSPWFDVCCLSPRTRVTFERGKFSTKPIYLEDLASRGEVVARGTRVRTKFS